MTAMCQSNVNYMKNGLTERNPHELTFDLSMVKPGLVQTILIQIVHCIIFWKCIVFHSMLKIWRRIGVVLVYDWILCFGVGGFCANDRTLYCILNTVFNQINLFHCCFTLNWHTPHQTAWQKWQKPSLGGVVIHTRSA